MTSGKKAVNLPSLHLTFTIPRRETIVDYIGSPQIHVEALTPNMMVFGDRAFKEIIKVKEVIRLWP